MRKDTGEIVLAFYGDDFTGSTDALEFLSRAGVRTVLFLDTPNAGKLSRYKGVEAVGIAGMTRSMVPEDMEKILRPAFELLKTWKPRHVHYKVCSTFDSSPAIGSIGRALDVGAEIFASGFTALLVAAPNLGRYCSFGNLFARMGIGSKGEIHRLDRHPSMSRHPVTPADESDLRLHLARQTTKQTGLFDILDIEKSFEEAVETLESLIRKGSEVVLFDALYEHQMSRIGKLIDRYASPQKPLFSVGSSGIEKALGDHWAQEGKLEKRVTWHEVDRQETMLVVSGSCSPVTAGQIEWALANGFAEVPLAPDVLAQDEAADRHLEACIKEVSELLGAGRSVILHTCKGPADPRVAATDAFFNNKGWDQVRIRTCTAGRYGKALGRIAGQALQEASVSRLVIAGGDTSGYVARELGIEAVEMIAPVFPGAPLCRAYAPGSPADGMEVNLKGGQVGDQMYFGALLNGKITT